MHHPRPQAHQAQHGTHHQPHTRTKAQHSYTMATPRLHHGTHQELKEEVNHLRDETEVGALAPN